MKNKKLRAYMVYCMIPEEGADLVFAYTAREARLIGFQNFPFVLGDYIDFRSHWLRDDEEWYQYGNPEKIAAGKPHIGNPPFCTACERWGSPVLIDGLCEYCHGDREYENEMVQP